MAVVDTFPSLSLSDMVLYFSLIAIIFFAILVILAPAADGKRQNSAFTVIKTYVKFAYNCFLKPHRGDSSRNQQDALESFYKAQASFYDATRVRLLRGREDMLGLVAAQLKHRLLNNTLRPRPIWVDIGGGTGFNIEQMAQFVDVPNFFGSVYLVDFSPSLCQVAVDRFERLGWKNVKVVCQDARHFRIEDYESSSPRPSPEERMGKRAELITMSYSLSMIPEFYSVVDSLDTLLTTNGVIGVADFYVQSEVDYRARNYIGGEINRHCMWLSRVFWRAWFEADRVNLEAARRDYLEYRFGTISSFNDRCRMLGLRIPYYVWIGCSKQYGSSQIKLAKVNAAVTESPYISALDLQSKVVEEAQRLSTIQIRSKAYESAVVNLAASLPLPATWYQNHHWRIHYDESLQKHRQFKDEYIYAFTWEDARVDARLLKIQEDDVILAITSAGDNILSYALERPRRIHAVDLNPTQNHLLELKVAAFTALPYSDFWKIFGDGVHPSFRELLITKLSPHMSSLAFQYWLEHGPRTFSGKGLYFTGGSRHAIQLTQWLFQIVGLKDEVKRLCEAQTLNEQREIWRRSIRRVLLSRLLSWTVISSKAWLWRALGVPNAQREIIEHDYLKQDDPVILASPTPEEGEIVEEVKNKDNSKHDIHHSGSGRAIWSYAVNTLDPVASETLIADDNHYYLLCLLGRYTRRCHPAYLSPRAHAKLSQASAFDGRLSIHTDEICEVLERMAPRTLTIAVVMDSMDWFNPEGTAARKQVARLNKALKMGGRVLLRSAGLEPWYVRCFEEGGFAAKRVAKRVPGSCIDRVNMYASTWICTKTAEVDLSPLQLDNNNIITSSDAHTTTTTAQVQQWEERQRRMLGLSHQSPGQSHHYQSHSSMLPLSIGEAAQEDEV